MTTAGTREAAAPPAEAPAPWRGYRYSAGGAVLTRAGAGALWQVLSGIGGENRYFAMNALWSAREWIDAALGGPGRSRQRPQGRPLRAGDRIDSWEVLAAMPGAQLALRFGMKAPGRGVLEFRIAPVDGGHRLCATAWWEPEGLAGLLYWRAMEPAHLVLFRRLTAEIRRRAESLEAEETRPAAPPAG